MPGPGPLLELTGLPGKRVLALHQPTVIIPVTVLLYHPVQLGKLHTKRRIFLFQAAVLLACLPIQPGLLLKLGRLARRLAVLRHLTVS